MRLSKLVPCCACTALGVYRYARGQCSLRHASWVQIYTRTRSRKARRRDRVVDPASRRSRRLCSQAFSRPISVRRLQYACTRFGLPQAIKNTALLGHGGGNAVSSLFYSDIPSGPNSHVRATASHFGDSKVLHVFLRSGCSPSHTASHQQTTYGALQSEDHRWRLRLRR